MYLQKRTMYLQVIVAYLEILKGGAELSRDRSGALGTYSLLLDIYATHSSQQHTSIRPKILGRGWYHKLNTSVPTLVHLCTQYQLANGTPKHDLEDL